MSDDEEWRVGLSPYIREALADGFESEWSSTREEALAWADRWIRSNGFRVDPARSWAPSAAPVNRRRGLDG